MSEREAVFEPERTKEHLQNSAPFNVSGGSVNPWIIGISVMLATFMEVLDTAIASVALPYIAGSLSASTDEATWVLTSYLVENAMVFPHSTWCFMNLGGRRFSP